MLVSYGATLCSGMPPPLSYLVTICSKSQTVYAIVSSSNAISLDAKHRALTRKKWRLG